jgi:WbqC-like protein family
VTKRVAIVQSNYIPWRGYFDLIGLVDEFVLFDDRQFTRRDWRNRNRIKTAQGTLWLTIPVRVKGRRFQRIDETEVDGGQWTSRHWAILTHAYRAAPHFDENEARFRRAYERCALETRLSCVNRILIREICEVLGIQTQLRTASEFPGDETKTERLLEICLQAGATTYLSGPAAKQYLDVSQFDSAGIAVEWMDYAGYPEYPQLHGPFEAAVTVLDLIFNTGSRAPELMQFGGRQRAAR